MPCGFKDKARISCEYEKHLPDVRREEILIFIDWRDELRRRRRNSESVALAPVGLHDVCNRTTWRDERQCGDGSKSFLCADHGLGGDCNLRPNFGG